MKSDRKSAGAYTAVPVEFQCAASVLLGNVAYTAQWKIWQQLNFEIRVNIIFMILY